MDRIYDSLGVSEGNATEGARSDNWVRDVIAMTRPGAEIVFPWRNIDEREIPFAYDDFR